MSGYAILSGPMFEPADDDIWRSSHRKEGGHYNTFSCCGKGMAALRQFFPDAKANEMNLVLFSTSGVHGTYNLIEEAEKAVAEKEAGVVRDTEDDEAPFDEVTFVIVQPRLCTIRYGNATPETAADIAFLKALRASSWEAALTIGRPEPVPGAPGKGGKAEKEAARG